MTTFARRARISSLKVTDFVVLNNRPCRIVERYPNGHNKLFVAATDIFTGECTEQTIDVRERFDVPHVFTVHYKLVNISSEGTVTVLHRDGAVRTGLKLPDNALGEQIRKAFTECQEEGGLDVTVTQSMGEEHITSFGLWENDA
uniref:Translation initiation factor 5A C-terminal domain-containing protein n=1 Tax=Phlebotomus papatasi TaxID=29031 RepID=A0A1B0CZB2_PHLPP